MTDQASIEKLSAALAETMASMRPTLDETAIRAIVQADVDSAVSAAMSARQDTVREVIVRIEPSAVAVNVGRQHETFPVLVQCVAGDVPVWLAGPAGAGKTWGAEKVAEALSLPFSAVSIGPQTSQAHLFGYMDATGTYRGTQIRERFEQGGLLLLDEIDRGNPGVLTALNALLANRVCAFPDGMVTRHADFRIIAAANTVGMGADRQYVGALQLDAATLDRFALLEWGYDEAFEMELATAQGGQAGAEWCRMVQAYRAAAQELKIRHTISPRATFHGIKLLGQGMEREAVESMTIWRGLDDASVSRIREHAKVAPSTAAPVDEHSADTPAETTPGGCPRCGNRGAVIRSKYSPGRLVCWAKRGGCKHEWSAA